MTLFYKLNIGPRLAVGFAIVLALLRLVAGAGMRGLSEVGSDLRFMYEDRAMPVEQLGDINRLMLRNRILVMDMMAFPEPGNVAKRDKELRANVEQIGKTWDSFTKTHMSADVHAKAGAFIDLRKTYVQQGLLPIRDAIVASKPEDATRVYREVLSPVSAKVAKALADLVTAEIAEGRQDFERSQADARTLLLMVLGLSGLAVLLGAGLAWLIT